MAWRAWSSATPPSSEPQVTKAHADPTIAEFLTIWNYEEHWHGVAIAEVLAAHGETAGTHIDFYRRHATERLAASRGAQRTTRFALKHLWRPVGTGVRPIEESRFVIQHLFGGPGGDAAIERIDRRVDRLPGQAGLCLMAQARTAATAA